MIALLTSSAANPSIAVNNSGRSIGEVELATFVRQQLARYGMDPGRLLLELAETTAVTDLQQLRNFTQSTREFGCLICLDDFGSGFSSFTYLRHIHADILKIDGTIIRDLLRDTESQVVVRASVAVAPGLGKKTAAEYAKDAATLTFLVQMDVDLVQGYFFDRPSPDPLALNG